MSTKDYGAQVCSCDLTSPFVPLLDSDKKN